jgi:hypothetical protein
MKKIIFTGILFSFTAIAIALILEVAVRVIFPDRFHYPDNVIITTDPFRVALGPNVWEKQYNTYLYTPGLPDVFWNVYTNRHGWREPDYQTTDKAPDTRRLMMLGDSVTFGFGIDYENSTCAFLQQSLFLTNQEWQVLNRSVPGWFGYHQYRCLEQEGPKWRPDIVVVNVVMNDFKALTDEELRKPVDDELGKHRLLSLFKRSHFYNMLNDLFIFPWMESYHELVAKPPLDSWYRKSHLSADRYGLYDVDKWWYIRGEYDTPQKEELYTRANQLSYPRYAELKKEAEKLGARFLVVIYPTASQVSKRYWSRQHQGEAILDNRVIREFSAYLRSQDIDHISLLEPFRQEETKALFIDECHLSKAGHQLAARQIIASLKEKEWIRVFENAFYE